MDLSPPIGPLKGSSSTRRRKTRRRGSVPRAWKPSQLGGPRRGGGGRHGMRQRGRKSPSGTPRADPPPAGRMGGRATDGLEGDGETTVGEWRFESFILGLGSQAASSQTHRAIAVRRERHPPPARASGSKIQGSARPRSLACRPAPAAMAPARPHLPAAALHVLLLAALRGAGGTEVLSKSRLERCERDSDAGGRLSCAQKLVLDLAVPAGSVSAGRSTLLCLLLRRRRRRAFRLSDLLGWWLHAERRRGVAGDQGGGGGERHRGDAEHTGSPCHHRQQERRVRGLPPHLPNGKLLILFML